MHTILSIEDNFINKHLLRRYFKHAEVILIEAETGQEGIRMAQTMLPDVILLDYHLPDMNGRAIAADIRRIVGLQTVTIIGLTADTTPILHRQMRTEGFDAVLTKPISVVNLMHTLDQFLHTKLLETA